MPWLPTISSSFEITAPQGSGASEWASSISPTCTCRPRRRSVRTPAAAVSDDPNASILTWTPPPVSSRRASASAVAATWSAPRSAARSRAAGEGSIAITRAPSAFPMRIADAPTPPHPYTASQSPADKWLCRVRAWKEVANRQPSEAAVTASTASGSRTRLKSAARTWTNSAYDPGWVNPGCVWSGHTWASPSRHQVQRPHPLTNGTVTRSPTAKPTTSGPTAATVPANSWPGIIGSGTGSWPRQAGQSERQMPVASTRTTAPSAGQAGSGTSTSSSGPPTVEYLTARMTTFLSPAPGTGRSDEELGGGELPVQGRGLEKLRVRSRRHHAALLEDNDLVGVGHGGQAVGDDQGGTTRRGGAERVAKQLFVATVEVRGRLVEQQHRRVREQGAGDREPLSLAPGQQHAVLADRCI